MNLIEKMNERLCFSSNQKPYSIYHYNLFKVKWNGKSTIEVDKRC